MDAGSIIAGIFLSLIDSPIITFCLSFIIYNNPYSEEFSKDIILDFTIYIIGFFLVFFGTPISLGLMLFVAVPIHYFLKNDTGEKSWMSYIIIGPFMFMIASIIITKGERETFLYLPIFIFHGAVLFFVYWYCAVKTISRDISNRNHSNQLRENSFLYKNYWR